MSMCVCVASVEGRRRAEVWRREGVLLPSLCQPWWDENLYEPGCAGISAEHLV